MTTATPPPQEATNNVWTPDFSHLEISEATARFDMPWVSPGAYLTVRTAMPENEDYQAASLRMSGNRQQAIALAGRLTNEDADEDRKEDRVLYPKYVVVGMGGVLNKKTGKEVPDTAENRRALVKALPRWIFDKLRLFCMRPERFLSPEDLDEQRQPNAGVVAGN